MFLFFSSQIHNTNVSYLYQPKPAVHVGKQSLPCHIVLFLPCLITIRVLFSYWSVILLRRLFFFQWVNISSLLLLNAKYICHCLIAPIKFVLCSYYILSLITKKLKVSLEHLDYMICFVFHSFTFNFGPLAEFLIWKFLS